MCRLAWGLDIGPQNVLEMESMNPKKFSRHVVIWLPNAAFQSGPDLGKFVKDAVLQHKAAHTLQIKSGRSMVPIVDTSVYSRCDSPKQRSSLQNTTLHNYSEHEF